METCAVMVVPCPERAEEILLAGDMPCPRCRGVLRPFGTGRTCTVRGVGADAVTVTRGGPAALTARSPRSCCRPSCWCGGPTAPKRSATPWSPRPAAPGSAASPPEPGGDAAEPGAAGLGDQGVADRFGAVGPPHQQLGRQQDLGDRAVSAAGPPRGHGRGVGSDAADGAGTTGPERAQHTPTPRAGHVPRQQDLLGPLGARHDHHGARLHSCQPALPITPRRREGPAGVARGQLSPRAVTKLPTRPTLGERPTIPGPPDRPTWASRFLGAVMTPTNHPRAHPASASPATTTPAVIGTHDGVQQPASPQCWCHRPPTGPRPNRPSPVDPGRTHRHRDAIVSAKRPSTGSPRPWPASTAPPDRYPPGSC